MKRSAKNPYDFVTEDGREIEVFNGNPVGDLMKGVLINGELLSWHVNKKTGEPHHDDIDEDGMRDLQLANFSSTLKEISAEGSAPPIESTRQILQMFSGFLSETLVRLRIGLRRSSIDFSFDGTVAQFKSYFKSNPSPSIEDYEDGENDVDFLSDYEVWAKTFSDSRTAQQLLGRGGRDDGWQDKDEDFSKSFSVYNNPLNKYQ